MFLAVPAVNGGMKKVDFEGKDKAPVNRHVKSFVKTYIRENGKNLHKIRRRSSSPFVIIDSVFNDTAFPLN